MSILNPELLAMAAHVVKKADGGTMAGGIPPMPQMPGMQPPAQDPAAQQPQQPAPGGAPGAIPGMDPMTAGMGMPQQPAAAAPQKLKPEQMMQMLDMRLYNMQQQLTAIAHTVGAKIDMGALVLPPGMQGAPPAETAIPGGPMDPMQNPAAQGGDPNAAAAGGAPAPGGAPPDPAAAAGGGAPPKMASDALIINGQSVSLDTPKIATDKGFAQQRSMATAISNLITSSQYANQGA